VKASLYAVNGGYLSVDCALKAQKDEILFIFLLGHHDLGKASGSCLVRLFVGGAT
jgi:hypothetical protein